MTADLLNEEEEQPTPTDLYSSLLLGSHEEEVEDEEARAATTELAEKVRGLQNNLAIMRTFRLLKNKFSVEMKSDGRSELMEDSVLEGLKALNDREAEVKEEEDSRRDRWGFVVPVADELTGVSLWLFHPSNSFRLRMQQFVIHPLFDNVVLFLILISSITLAMDVPTLDEDSSLAGALTVMDIIFTTVFVIEMLLKIIVLGFVLDPNAYIRNEWNQLDFFIVLISVISVSGALDSGGLRSLRTLRALRPLRTIKRAPGLRCAVETIVRCLPPFFNIAIVSAVCYLIFAIMGVQFWAGKFWKCTDETVKNVTECIAAGGQWLNAPINFDNVLNGMLTLFEVASLELWLDVMYNSMDAPSNIGEQPVMNCQWWSSVYYVVFIIIGSFLVMNLFVGAVVDTFGKVKAEQERSGMLSDLSLIHI
eukprot:TRINITY_DN4377_c0_g1_i1.p1 TRINITY_DN4377_c0_g1~~TRINITY_DN4377_c0_g1_i1.p1  ORF type:complete len:421 (+),score=130.40 TRINITY_DN4377_c0_g1_i1:2-1264(+)